MPPIIRSAIASRTPRGSQRGLSWRTLFPDQVATIGDRAADQSGRLVEELLRPATGARDRQDVADQWRELNRLQSGDGAALHEILDVVLRQRLDGACQPAGKLPCQSLAVRRGAQPACRTGRRLNSGQACIEHRPRQEMVLDEVAEDAADPVLLGLHDCRVRDGQAEWPAKERGDGEPVGQAPDQRCFGSCAHVAEPGMSRFEYPCDDKHRKRDHQHAGCDQLHPAERDPARVLVERCGRRHSVDQPNQSTVVMRIRER